MYTIASSWASHAEGHTTEAAGDYSHAEGQYTRTGNKTRYTDMPSGAAYAYGHAEGYATLASGTAAHAEGQCTVASAKSSHAEGEKTEAKGPASHAEGTSTVAGGGSAHAEGSNTIANGRNSHVQGMFNLADTSATDRKTGLQKYAHIVGNGTATARSNAHTLDWSGNAWFAGDVYVGGTSQDDTSAKKLATVDEVESLVGSSAGSTGGGNKYELLLDVTTEEEVTYIYQEFDPVSVARFLIFIDAVMPETLTNTSLTGVYANLNINAANVGNQWTAGGIGLPVVSSALLNAKDAKRQTAYIVELDESGGGLCWNATTDNRSNPYVPAVISDDMSTIFNIRVCPQTWDNSLGAGTRVRIWGVKA